MTTTIDQSYAKGYSELIHDLARQQGSKLMDAVRIETRKQNVDFFDRYDDAEDSEKISRLQASPAHEPAHSRRQVSYREYQYYPILDNADEQKMLVDPKSKYVQGGLNVYGRRMDRVIFDAAFGTAKAGADGGTDVTFPAGQKTTATGGLTKAKLIEAKELLSAADADEGPNGDENYLACTAYQISDILNDTTLTSGDYNEVLLLMQGKIDTLMGFKWIKVSTDIVPKVSTTRRCLVWNRNGLLLSRGEMKAEIVRRADLSGAWQVQMDYALGAVRMEEARVVEIPCVES